MYKVLIVDDEGMIREGIKSIVDWHYYGFEIVDECEDGLSGQAVLLDKSPDLVLADIRMPGQSGIEMLTGARSKGYKGKALY